MNNDINHNNPANAAAMIDAVLRKETNWEELWFYQKTVVLYQLTYVFTKRFLSKYGDRTVDQMVQAARSGKQNIVEGMADGVTSMELELKLLNVARASLKELREDYEDYLLTRRLARWQKGHLRYKDMLDYCSQPAARLGYRNMQKSLLEAKDREIARLQAEIARLQTEVERLKSGQGG